MPDSIPPNADDVRPVVEQRLAALDDSGGVQESVTIEWRGLQKALPVITMPLAMLTYNPDTHRVKAQRSLDPVRDKDLEGSPFGPSGQAYLHYLLMGDPSDPAKTDPSFEALKEDLREHGQSDPGLITRDGVLINGNTRRAALKELGQEHIRVGVLPADAGIDDRQSIELSLQLRKDYRRDYSFMNFLLALDERVKAGKSASDIQGSFHMRATTYERNLWILAFVREAIQRSQVGGAADTVVSMRLVDFESDQGKLEELYKAYAALKTKSPDEAEALREQRLVAIVLGKSKTDVRLIQSDFAERYMKGTIPASAGPPGVGIKIPGTSIVTAAPSTKVTALRKLTDEILQAKAIALAPGASPQEKLTEASAVLKKVDEALDGALDQAGKQGRVIKKRFAAADRISDANDDLELSVAAISEARATSTFNAEDLDEALIKLKATLFKLAQLVARSPQSSGDGIAWLLAAARADRSEK